MKTPKHSLRKIVTFLNNPEEEGGFWLPNIQRAFVWDEDQMCRLFDSIMREYPISTLLVWKTKSRIRCRKFIDNYRPGMRTTDFYVPENGRKKCLVLDGQQRLQSLFIGLKGSFEGRELFFDILSGDVAAPDDVKYRFEFKDTGASFPWIRFKDLVFSRDHVLTAAESILSSAPRELTPAERMKISEHVSITFRAFRDDDGISYQELDSIDNEGLYSEDDVVEIFIRANSGGTRLGKSDLLFSLLTASWDRSDEEMQELLDDLNRHGYEFSRDFVLKTCLTLVNQGARYQVEKFRRPEVKTKIESEWEHICDSIKEVLDFLRSKTYLRCHKALPSYLVLIPLIYLRHHYPDAWRSAVDVDTYLVRTSLSGAFSGTPDQLIDECVKKMNDLNGFDLNEIFGVIRSKGRSLEITEERLWNMGYGSKHIHLLFNLWYREFNYTPAYTNNMPQVDHIFPQSLLRSVKKLNPNTGRRDLLQYRQAERNVLANCMLLTQQENGPSGKSNTPPEKWFTDKGEDYLKKHLIPEDPALWTLERFDDFTRERGKLIRKKFTYLLAPSHG